MKAYDWYMFIFEDGYNVTARGFSKTELKREEMKHGKLLSKTYMGRM